MTIQANFPNVQPSLLLDFANAKQLPPSVTFTRATTAAYYDGSTTAMAEQNLFTYSQDFSNAAWTVDGATKTSTNNTDPAGGSTALLLTKNSANGYSLRQYAFAGGSPANLTATISFYLKGTAGDTVVLYLDNGVNQGFVSTVTLTASWDRYTLTGTFNSTTANLTGGVSFRSPSTATSVYVAFAQVEYRATATAYTATTTQAITNYIPVLLTAGGGQPRFDHNPTTSESLGLLVEETRTNQCTDSVSLLATGAASVTSVATVAPDGSTNCRLVNVPSGYAYTGGMSSVVGGNTTWTYSFYIKNYSQFGSATSARIGLAGSNNTLRVTVDNLTTVPTVSFSDATNASLVGSSVLSVGNGWYRISVTGTYTGSVSYNEFQILTTTNTLSAFIWGMQLEQGFFATSYIPTTSAAATRAADVVSMSGANFSSWYSPGNGTFYAEAATASVAGDVMIAEGTNSSNGYLDFSLTFATTGTQFINRFVATNNDMRRSNVVAVNTMVKFSGSITNSSGTSVASVSGLTVSSAGSQGANFGADRMFIGSRGGSSLFINAPIKKFAFYPAQLTQTQQNSITG